jgi:uncharacterized Zn-binding protein involved in type VI secretion
MPLVAILNDPIKGTTIGEHHGHSDHPHGPLQITGKINGKVSTKLFINNLGVATVGSTTEETDGCCNGDNAGGVIITGFDKIKVQGKVIAMVGSEIDAHNGSAHVSNSSQKKITVG